MSEWGDGELGELVELVPGAGRPPGPPESLGQRAGGVLAVACCFGGAVGVVLGLLQALVLSATYHGPAFGYQVSSGAFMAILGAVAFGAGVAIFRAVL